MSFLVTCITSDSRQIFPSVIFMKGLTSGVMRTSSGFLGVYCESLIFTSHIFFSSCYPSFFVRTFFPHSTELDQLLSSTDSLDERIPWPREAIQGCHQFLHSPLLHLQLLVVVWSGRPLWSMTGWYPHSGSWHSSTGSLESSFDWCSSLHGFRCLEGGHLWYEVILDRIRNDPLFHNQLLIM